MRWKEILEDIQWLLEDIQWKVENIIGGIRYCLIGVFRKPNFTFVGNRSYIRVPEELALIDKKEADDAFKKCKEEIMDKLLFDNGFCKWKTNSYARLNGIGVLEYIDLQKEQYGSKTFCVNFAVMPLYCGETFMCLGLGHRLGHYITGREDIWWDFGCESIAAKSFQNVADAITQYVFPWFQELSSEEAYRKRLTKDKTKKFPLYPAEEWLAASQIEDKEQLIQDGIRQLKLPKKMMDRKI